MQKDGQGALFGPGREDGPLPEFYEPMESPFEKHAFSAQRSNPVAFKAIGEVLAVADERFPFIGTTYRVTEHWQTGLMTRRCSWLVEAEPQVFAELDPRQRQLDDLLTAALLGLQFPQRRRQFAAKQRLQRPDGHAEPRFSARQERRI